MKLALSSKAKTLQDLREVLETAKVLPLIKFYAKDYSQDKESILEECKKSFFDKVIVRSSSFLEDCKNSSNAGSFQSIPNVKIDHDNLNDAVLKVIESYGKFDEKDEVFIQPMLSEVDICGVVFTSDIDTLAPYYIVNFDDSGYTDIVTSGKDNNLKTFIVLKECLHVEDVYMKRLISTCKECEEIL